MVYVNNCLIIGNIDFVNTFTLARCLMIPYNIYKPIDLWADYICYPLFNIYVRMYICDCVCVRECSVCVCSIMYLRAYTSRKLIYSFLQSQISPKFEPNWKFNNFIMFLWQTIPEWLEIRLNDTLFFQFDWSTNNNSFDHCYTIFALYETI